MTGQKNIDLAFDLTAAPPSQPQPEFYGLGCMTVLERNSRPMPGRAGRPGEVSRVYNFALGAAVPVLEYNGKENDPGRTSNCLKFADLDRTMVAVAHYKLRCLGGMPPALELCLNPAAQRRLLEKERKAEESLRKWRRWFPMSGDY